MTPNDRNDEPSDLLRELENLQRVLDDAAAEHSADIPVLEPLDDIPVLNDLFTGDDIPVLKAVASTPANVTPLRPNTPRQEAPIIKEPATAIVEEAATTEAPQEQAETRVELTEKAEDAVVTALTPEITAPAPARPYMSANPFLPQSVLDRLAQEREAAQSSAEEAHRTMQRVMEQKQNRAEEGMTELGRSLSAAQKERMIEQLVAEMLPEITEKLKDRLRNMLR